MRFYWYGFHQGLPTFSLNLKERACNMPPGCTDPTHRYEPLILSLAHVRDASDWEMTWITPWFQLRLGRTQQALWWGGRNRAEYRTIFNRVAA